MKATRKPGHCFGKGFTLIELMVVMVIIALLLTIAAPRYFDHIDRAREATLQESLNVMRDAIDKYYGDTGKYPQTLDELVTRRYLRRIPVDPLTDSSSTWIVVPPPLPAPTGVYDVHSGASGKGRTGTPYREW